MGAIARREFLKKSAGAASAGLITANPLKLFADPLGLPIGCQTWPVRAMIVGWISV